VRVLCVCACVCCVCACVCYVHALNVVFFDGFGAQLRPGVSCSPSTPKTLCLDVVPVVVVEFY